MSKKRKKKYNPNKVKRVEAEALLKNIGTYFISGITKTPGCFRIDTGEAIKYGIKTALAVEETTWYWYVDCSVLLREKNLKEKVVSVAYQFSAAYYRSDAAIYKYLNKKHKELIGSFGKNKDLIITAAWVAIPIYKDEYGINSEGQRELPREYLHDFYTKQGAFNFLAKWEADKLEQENEKKDLVHAAKA